MGTQSRRGTAAAGAVLAPHRSRGTDLALSTPADIGRARDLVDELVLTARTVLAAARHDPDVARCPAAGCGFADTDDPELCRLAHQLAGSASVPCEAPAFPVALDAFRAAVTRASEAVGVCRRTAHPHGACWFSALPGVDGCAAVLRGAHRIG